MQLQTKINIQPERYNPIDYKSKVLLLGSCFTENIGKKLHYYKFQNVINPFGILFHPLAIEDLITNSINNKKYAEEDVFYLNEQWHCFEAHSKLSSSSKQELLELLNKAADFSFKSIQESSNIIITLGTAWVYRHIETDTIVANCHKLTQKHFNKELLSVETVSESLEAIISLIKSVNPNVNIIFTVSPVRHLKDGFKENTLSKAHLIAGIHQVIEPRKKIHYFPSFEIMMDELRDYRFYADDMIHPNQTAINYIWEKFRASWVSQNAEVVMEAVNTIQKGLNHKPFNPNSEAHKQFRQNLSERIVKLQSQFPHIIF